MKTGGEQQRGLKQAERLALYFRKSQEIGGNN